MYRELLLVLSYADYYPFGWKIPGRQSSSSNGYRLGYQGQFAEEDQETGLNQFEARLYDPRIGRWLTTDPAGQFHSPYLGMGNNPIGGVDKDGGVAVQVVTGVIGALVNTGITLYVMADDANGISNIDWNGKALTRVGAAFITGGLAGSGLSGSVVSSLLGNGSDQFIKNDFSFENFDLVEFGTSGGGALVGGLAGDALVDSRWIKSLIDANVARGVIQNGEVVQGVVNEMIKKGTASTIGSYAGWQLGNFFSDGINNMIDSFSSSTLEISNFGTHRVDGVVTGGVPLNEVVVTPSN